MLFRSATLFSFLISSVLAQAPGDGDAPCVETGARYAANVRVLMDSRDYVDLLQGENSVWQQVDNDNNNTEHVTTSVRQFSCLRVRVQLLGVYERVPVKFL